jgi:hypothetical protein
MNLNLNTKPGTIGDRNTRRRIWLSLSDLVQENVFHHIKSPAAVLGLEGKRLKRGRGKRKRKSKSTTPNESAKVTTSSDDKDEVLVAGASDLLSATLTGNEHRRSEWIVDSGATAHLCGNREWFISYRPLDPPRKIVLGNKKAILAPGIGQVKVTFHTGNSPGNTIIRNVLYCWKIAHNLWSVIQLNHPVHTRHS